MDTVDFAERIKQRRKELGMTQMEIARTLQVTPQHVSAIELGKRVPSLSFVAGLAKQLGVTTDYLIAGKEQLIPDTISVLRADQQLPLEIRQALIIMVKALREKK